jgi:radical SAM protein with 4Fe4S-binding SPASM domain
MNWKALLWPKLDHQVRHLPVLVVNVNATCDSRCAGCDYWRSRNGPRLGTEALDRVLPDLGRWGTRQVLVSGGEPLVHPDLPRLCERLRKAGLFVLLHTNGLRLQERAPEVCPWVDHLYVSLDGATPDTYRRLRGVDGFDAVLGGIRQVREDFPALPVSSRTVLMRGNLLELEALVELGLQQDLRSLSFLGVDLHSEAFGRDAGGPRSPDGLLPSEEELGAFGAAIGRLPASAGPRIEGAFESLWRIHARLHALARGRMPHAPRCNAPWYSAVLEPNGEVRPCFFHRPYGRRSGEREGSLESIINGPEALAFRSGLDVRRDPTCRQCACWKWTGWRERLRSLEASG